MAEPNTTNTPLESPCTGVPQVSESSFRADLESGHCDDGTEALRDPHPDLRGVPKAAQRPCNLILELIDIYTTKSEPIDTHVFGPRIHLATKGYNATINKDWRETSSDGTEGSSRTSQSEARVMRGRL